MAYTVTVESAIRTGLVHCGPCTFDALLQRLPQFSWSEVFTAVDRLSREGRLVLRHPTRFDYEVSIDPTQPAPEPVHAGRDVGSDRSVTLIQSHAREERPFGICSQCGLDDRVGAA